MASFDKRFHSINTDIWTQRPFRNAWTPLSTDMNPRGGNLLTFISQLNICVHRRTVNRITHRPHLGWLDGWKDGHRWCKRQGSMFKKKILKAGIAAPTLSKTPFNRNLCLQLVIRNESSLCFICLLRREQTGQQRSIKGSDFSPVTSPRLVSCGCLVFVAFQQGTYRIRKLKLQPRFCVQGCEQRAKDAVFWRSMHVFLDNNFCKSATVEN